MHSQRIVLVAGVAAIAGASPISTPQIDIEASGFINPSISYSTGGHAVCIGGLLPVQVSGASNVQLNLSQSIDQSYSTQLLLSLNSVNSSTADQLTRSTHEINQTFNISSKLCYPRTVIDAKNESADLNDITTVQFLTHGIAFDSTHWDFAAPNNSYVDVAALANRATFLYDRLGVGKSAQPDPIQIVQGPTEIALAHSLIRMLRSQSLLGMSPFKHVIGVGHSYGSALTTSIASQYPEDLDAVVVTGFSSSNITGATQFASSLNLLPASSSPSKRFSPDLADGYLLPTTQYGVQYSFFHYPNFESSVLAQAFATIQTTTWGEQLTMGTVGHVADNFTGPVYVINGQYDLFFCDADCSYPADVSAETLSDVFPKADVKTSDSLVFPATGHGINLGSNAVDAFSQIQDFITKTGL
jgi:pimeloyl-ACP methyl ester carboxylesterase